MNKFKVGDIIRNKSGTAYYRVDIIEENRYVLKRLLHNYEYSRTVHQASIDNAYFKVVDKTMYILYGD